MCICSKVHLYLPLCLIISRYIIMSIYAMNDILNKPSTDLAVNL